MSWAVQLPQRYTSLHIRRLLRYLVAWQACTEHSGSDARSESRIDNARAAYSSTKCVTGDVHCGSTEHLNVPSADVAEEYAKQFDGRQQFN